MAIETAGGNASMDYAEHQRTYAGFVKMTQIGIAAMVLLLLAMAAFLL